MDYSDNEGGLYDPERPGMDEEDKNNSEKLIEEVVNKLEEIIK